MSYMLSQPVGTKPDLQSNFEAHKAPANKILHLGDTDYALACLPDYTALNLKIGGGDYYGAKQELAGSWIGDTIYGTNEPPENRTLIDNPFKE